MNYTDKRCRIIHIGLTVAVWAVAIAMLFLPTVGIKSQYETFDGDRITTKVNISPFALLMGTTDDRPIYISGDGEWQTFSDIFRGDIIHMAGGDSKEFKGLVDFFENPKEMFSGIEIFVFIFVFGIGAIVMVSVVKSARKKVERAGGTPAKLSVAELLRYLPPVACFLLSLWGAMRFFGICSPGASPDYFPFFALLIVFFALIFALTSIEETMNAYKAATTPKTSTQQENNE